MYTVNAYAATSATAPLSPTVVERRSLGPDDVLIDVEYCGICHSDIHTVRGEWGPQSYPLTPGHEIVGLVAEIGSGVTGHRIGDRVGVGCMVGSCRVCEPCRAGQEQYCDNGATFTYASVDRDGAVTQGGYSTRIVVTEDFVVKVPEGIGPAEAAPLLCAGITTYSPLRRWGAGPGRKVAIVGLGGLGHMAVKIAHAMGVDVTVLSHSLKKMDDGLRMGAQAYHSTADPDTFMKLAGAFDLIMNTVSAPLSLDDYVSLLKLDGALVNLGAPAQPMALSVFPLIQRRRVVTGSNIGGIAETQEMFDFCAAHGIGAEVQVIAAEEINDAYERVLASDVRYRFVIDTATMR